MKDSCKRIFLILLTAVASSCSVLRKSPKTNFTDGFYKQQTNHKKITVYINIEDNVLLINQTKKDSNRIIIDTTETIQFSRNESKNDHVANTVFEQYSFDIDFLTIPLKFRPAQKEVPLQLNTNLNGAGYFGYRTDRFKIKYVANPMGISERTINHYGFSMGGFIGIGNTAVTPTTTDNYIAIEYDGVVWTKGIAGIIAINNFTLGLTIGFDNLLDTNRKSWIYETKPWFGLAFGLNLN